MSRKIIGIEIRPQSLNATLINSGFKSIICEAFEQIAFDNFSASDEEFESAVQRISEKIDTTDATVVISIPSNLISFRNLRVPFHQEKRIKQILRYELEPTLPFIVDETIIDFIVSAHEENGEQSDLLATIVKNTVIENFIAGLNANQLDPELITINGLSLAFLIAQQSESENGFLFVDSDENHLTFFLILNKQIKLIRPITIKKQEKNPNTAIVTFLNQSLITLEEKLDFQVILEKIYWCENSTKPIIDKEALARSLDLELKSIDLEGQRSIDYSKIQGFVPLDHAKNCVSLALTEIDGYPPINFRQDHSTFKKKWGEHKKDFIKTGIFIAVTFLFFLYNIIYENYSLDHKIKHLDAQIKSIYLQAAPEAKNIPKPVHQFKELLKTLKKSTVGTKNTEKNALVVDILDDLSRLIADSIDVELTRMVIGPETVLISGNTASFNAVDDIQNSLQTSQFFSKITIASANMEKMTKRVQFKLKVQL